MLTRIFGSVAEARQAISDSTLAHRQEVLLALLRPTILYRPVTAMMPAGASRLGGAPDLAPALSWPKRPAYPDADSRNAEVRYHPAVALQAPERQRANGRRNVLIGTEAYLAFLGQIDLEQAAATQALDVDLPPTGRLLFFYDARECPFGFDRYDDIGVRVIWDDAAPSAIRRAATPGELTIDRLVLPETGLVPEGGFMLPAWDSPVGEALRLSPDEFQSYLGLTFTISEMPSHLLGGWGDRIQSGWMELQCALGRLDVWEGQGQRGTSEQRAEALRHQDDWCLLAQFDCGAFATGGMEHEFLDGLWLYFWIERADLAARRFDRVWVLARR